MYVMKINRCHWKISELYKKDEYAYLLVWLLCNHNIQLWLLENQILNKAFSLKRTYAKHIHKGPTQLLQRSLIPVKKTFVVKLCVHFVSMCQKDLKNGHRLTLNSLFTPPHPPTMKLFWVSYERYGQNKNLIL